MRGPDGRPVIDRLAVTKAITSVQPDHPELVAARDVGIVPESVQQIVADAAATGGRRLIGVTGTHGKSTTSGWLLHLLVGAGRDPSGFVGANLPASIVGPQRGVARFGSGPDFVVEADEYAGNFDPYRPDIAVLVSAEWDHPDVFLDETEVVEAFAEWIAHGRPGGDRTLVANVGDPGVRRVIAALDGWDGRRIAVRLIDERRPDETGAPTPEPADRAEITLVVGSSGRTPTGRTSRSAACGPRRRRRTGSGSGSSGGTWRSTA